MIKKVLTKLNLSETIGPDQIPVVVLKNCGPELSYIIAEFHLKESCFRDCWIVPLVVPVLNNVKERCLAKNCHPVCLLSVVSKVFEKLLNNRLVDDLEKCVLGFLDQLQIHWQLYLIKLLRLLIILGLL